MNVVLGKKKKKQDPDMSSFGPMVAGWRRYHAERRAEEHPERLDRALLNGAGTDEASWIRHDVQLRSNGAMNPNRVQIVR